MKPGVERKFETIANEAISEAEGVVCSFDNFVEGLAYIVDTLKDRLSMAKEEQERDR